MLNSQKIVLVAICVLAFGLVMPRAQQKPPAAPKASDGVAREEVAAPAHDVIPGPAPAAKYEPTEAETWKLKAKLDEAQLAQVATQQAQSRWQQSISDFNATVAEVKKAHNWPDTIQIDQQALNQSGAVRFVDAPKPPEKK